MFAHSRNDAGRRHLLRDHLAGVRDLAGRFAESVGLTDDARLAGLLHDLGKYGELFQARLRGESKGIDHWSAGAWIAVRHLRAPAAALAIHGHHIGLHPFKATLEALDPRRLAQHHKLGLALSDPDPEKLFALLKADGLAPDAGAEPELRRLGSTAGAMLDVRLLFSCLVDADFLDTEAHFAGDAEGKCYRPPGLLLQAERALDVLTRHVEGLAASTRASPAVSALRADLWGACLSAAERDCRLWTLSAPTGSGKTLAMLGFALRHAITHGLRRIVIVIPYLSIIEQTARVLRAVFEPAFGPEYVIEHHSLTGTGREKSRNDAVEEHARRARLLAENWDAPIVVTTSVQALESLFSNRPAACRKLHRLAEAVVLFDEVQTLPLDLIVPTLATLAHLGARRRTTIVFATATQPAFASLDADVRALERTPDTPVWVPAEIVPSVLDLFARARRVRPQWPSQGERRSWDALARELRAVPQALCIVNTKRHARDLARALGRDGSAATFHLSTQMCPAHRHDVLARVRELLTDGRPCRLVSTQCVEAGVDVDFPLVYRALAPLEAVAQAAGRCNREGRAEHGTLVVFEPEDGGWPTKTYEQAAGVTRTLLQRRGAAGMDLDDPALFDEYYRRFFAFRAPGQGDRELREAIAAQDFPEVAQLYRLIREDRINVLVPYDEARFDALRAEIEAGEARGWRRRAQAHAVSVFRPDAKDPLWTVIEPVPLARGTNTLDTDWWVLRAPEHYDRELLGLLPAEAPAVWLL